MRARFTNFRSVRGVASAPYPIVFTTGDAKPGSATAAGQRSEAAEAIAELRQAIDQDYSYRDLRNVNWDRAFARHRKAMLAAKSPGQFAQAVAKLLAAARDPHMWLKVDGRTIPTFQRRVRPNVNLEALARTVPQWRQRSECVWTARFEDDIGYIMIGGWGAGDAVALEPAFEALADFAETKALIVDVRANGGGSEPLARFFAGCFVDEPVLYAKHVYRDSQAPDGFTPPQNRMLQPKKARPRYRGKVAVLTGPAILSSCEAFLLMMAQAPNCRLVGGASGGSSGNPKPTHIGMGVTVYLPSWKAMRPDGSVFEGEGIAPDLAVPYPATGTPKVDPVLKAALKMLRGEP